jgi:predicted CopG family antitoxin
MSRTIQISDETYSHLEKLAVGFDTPEAVIVRLLGQAEGKPESKPSLSFYPEDEVEFKRQLLDTKEAEVVIYKVDGSREINHWKASRLSNSSNLRGNLWSGPLRNWKDKGIQKVDLSILPKELNIPGDETATTKALAAEFQLTYDEMDTLTYEIDSNLSDDDLVYNYIIQFDNENDPSILAKINGLTEHLWINVDASVLN